MRLFVIFLDDYHVRLGNSIAVKEPLTEFVQTQLRPNDVVGIMYPLTPLDGICRSPRTRRRRERDRAVRGAEVRLPPRNLFEEQYARAVRGRRADSQPGGHDALRRWPRGWGLREGRKSIIYVSEGSRRCCRRRCARERVARPRSNPAAGPHDGRNSPARDGRGSPSRSLLAPARRLHAANRNNAAIYTLDPRGLTPFEYDIDEAVGRTRIAARCR